MGSAFPSSATFLSSADQALGFPFEMFTVLFAIPRTAGGLSQWEERLTESEQKIARPRQIYCGSGTGAYVPLAKRS